MDDFAKPSRQYLKYILNRILINTVVIAIKRSLTTSKNWVMPSIVLNFVASRCTFPSVLYSSFDDELKMRIRVCDYLWYNDFFKIR